MAAGLDKYLAFLVTSFLFIFALFTSTSSCQRSLQLEVYSNR